MNKKEEDTSMYSNSGSRKYSNNEGYSDPTAGRAIDRLDRENPVVTRTLYDTDIDLTKLAKVWSIKH